MEEHRLWLTGTVHPTGITRHSEKSCNWNRILKKLCLTVTRYNWRLGGEGWRKVRRLKYFSNVRNDCLREQSRTCANTACPTTRGTTTTRRPTTTIRTTTTRRPKTTRRTTTRRATSRRQDKGKAMMQHFYWPYYQSRTKFGWLKTLRLVLSCCHCQWIIVADKYI